VSGSLADAAGAATGAVAFAPAEPPTAERAAALAPACARAARAGAPVVALAAFERAEGDAATERAAALAFLRAHGAVVCADPDTWLETLALVAAYELPGGPRVSIVAPPGSWLALSATALAAERRALGRRAAPLHRDATALGPTDVVLVDRAELSRAAPARVGDAKVVPIVGRPESLVAGAQVALVGLREAIAAATLAGRCAQRIERGLGPAPAHDADAFAADTARFARQRAQLADRAGDHETKVMLAAWGVRITRQAVATTPSAATRLAARAGWPVQIKPWSADCPPEPDGCPVATELYSAPDVRRAFAGVARDARLDDGAPMIVRETPPAGRDVRVHIRRIGALGWTVVLEARGAPVVAAPAPLRDLDARELTRWVEATRTTDPEPDRDALAELLRRASHMVVAHEADIESLDLCRVIVAPKGDGALVADARAALSVRGR
jgi:hypothetical protein